MATRAPDDVRCKDCPNPRGERPDGSLYSRCDDCREKRRESEAATREQRRDAGKCLTCGRKAVANRSYCKAHLTYYRERWVPRAERT